MDFEKIKTLPIIRPLGRLLSSSKFWVMAIAVALSYGLEISPEVQALILFLSGGTWAGTTAWEDAADKRGG